MIKYRAWRFPDDEYKKGWWIHPSQLRIYPDGIVEYHIWDGEWESQEWFDCDDIDIQKYIMYWEGQEIYEGDIIKHEVTIDKVKGLKAETILVLDLNDIKTLELIVRLNKYKDMDQKIIKLGNKYDNPELLETNK